MKKKNKLSFQVNINKITNLKIVKINNNKINVQSIYLDCYSFKIK